MIYREVQTLASPLPKVLVRRQRQIVRTLSEMAHSWAKKWMNLEPNYQSVSAVVTRKLGQCLPTIRRKNDDF